MTPGAITQLTVRLLRRVLAGAHEVVRHVGLVSHDPAVLSRRDREHVDVESGRAAVRVADGDEFVIRLHGSTSGTNDPATAVRPACVLEMTGSTLVPRSE